MAENKCCKEGCCGVLDEETHPSSIMMMRIFGVLAVIFSVIEFGLGGAATGFLVTEVSVGSWWVGLVPIAIGICGMITKNRGGVIAIIVLGSIAMLVAVAGAIVDSYRVSELSGLKTCITVSAGSSLPSSRAINYACYVPYASRESYDRCLCSIGSADADCQIYRPNSKYSCDDIMVTLPSVLKSSIAICSILAFCSIVLAAVGCSIVCCTGTAEKEPTTKPEEQPDNSVLVDNNIVVGVNSNPKAN